MRNWGLQRFKFRLKKERIVIHISLEFLTNEMIVSYSLLKS